MKKVICKVEYDTEASELVAKHTVGGAQSPYTEEGIKRMSAAKADEWLAENK